MATQISNPGHYFLFSETDGFPFNIPGVPPKNKYKWLMATDFNLSDQNTITKYFTPNISQTKQLLVNICDIRHKTYTKLSDGSFMLRTSYYDGSGDTTNGSFFLNINSTIQPIAGTIIRQPNSGCSSTPNIKPDGTIYLGNTGGNSDSFNVAIAKNGGLVAERKYPKYAHPNRPAFTSAISVVSLDMPGKQLVVMNQSPLNGQPDYTEILSENVYVNNPLCQARNVAETDVRSVGVYSHAIAWDTVFSVGISVAALTITQDTFISIHQPVCNIVSRCDSVTLTAPAMVCEGENFEVRVRRNANCYKEILLYRNSAAVSLVSITGDSIFVLKALIAGAYTFTARFKDCRDTLYQTTVVGVRDTMPPINVSFTDSIICKGSSITINAPLGYKTYNWNNGLATGNSLITNNAGLFTVTATSFCNNISKDSVLIKFDTSQLNIEPKSVAICLGDTAAVKYDQGKRFSHFTWQPNTFISLDSNSNTISVWPKFATAFTFGAKSAFGCAVKDSFKVEILESVDTNKILPATLFSICAGDSIMVATTKPFSKYLWSTGATTPSILIKRADKYFVTVSNQFGCNANAPFEVKEIPCIRTVYFPTAFTPNNDGLNDIFRAAVPGLPPNQYQLEVFNRWGQLLFRTTNVRNGWHGRISGVELPAGAYVWHCKYAYPNQPYVFLKGTIMLIR